ncbi:MAG TPA: PAS domain S-box protein [Anaerolineales bacterium]|nr:PAS domain S-box protein [Anaerolineales bacterium]
MSLKNSPQKVNILKGRDSAEFRKMFGNHPTPVWIHDRESFAILAVNQALSSLLGYEPTELEGISLENIFPVEEVSSLYADLKLPRQIGHSPREWHLRSKSGQLISIDQTFSSLIYEGSEAALVIVHLRTDQTLESRILGSRLRISEFAHSHSLDDLLQKTLDEAELLTQSNIGFFHFVEKDQKTLSLQNWSTNTLKNMCTAEGKWSHYSIDEAGVWVDCVRFGGPVIYNDYPGLEHRKGLPPGHAPISRLLSVPVTRGGSVVAILGVGNKVEEYNESDIASVYLLADLAWDITVGKRTEHGLHQSEERLRLLFDKISNIAVQGYAPDGTVRLWNQASEKIYGYTKDEALGRNLLDLIIPEEMRADVEASVKKMIGTMQPIPSEELSLKRKDGSRVSVYSNHTVVEISGVGRELYCIDIDLSERKSFEEALRESEEKYRQLFEAESDAIFLIDNETGQIFEVNSAATKIYGYTREELIRMRNVDLSAEPDNTRKAMQSKMVNIPVRWHRKKNGVVFPVEISASHLMWKGRPIHIAAIRDITERKQAEDALHESEAQYRLMFQNNPHPMWVYDLNTLKFLEVNDAAISHYGYSRDEFLRMTILEVQSVDSLAMLRAPLVDPFLQDYRSGVWQHRKKNGMLIEVEITQHDTLFNGNAARLILANDITERKQAENALREKELRHRIVADNTADWEFWRAPDGKFLYSSPSCREVTGHTMEEFISDDRLLERIIHPDDLATFNNHRHFELTAKMSSEVEFRIVLPDGWVHWIGHVCQPVFDDQNSYLGIRGSNRNITARKQAEEDLHRTKKSLEEVNSVLLAAIEREQRISRTDSLTETYNRRYFFEIATHECSVAERYRQPLSLIMFDIDNFKKFNDIYGHQVGDEVLRRIAQVAREQLRSADILARYGGEEFTVLLPKSNTHEALIVAERIREKVAACKLDTGNGVVGITISIGVAEYFPDQQTLDDLIRNSDKALYTAKEKGRNQVSVYATGNTV